MFFANYIFRHFIEEDEQILHIFRHPLVFTISKMCVRLTIWGFLSLFMSFFISGKIFGGIFQGDFSILYTLYDAPQHLIWFLIILWGIFRIILPLAFWYTNIILMTNESLLFIDWPKFFIRRFNRVDFSNLDEIEVERIGFISYLLNYAHLHFKKINGGQTFCIKEIAHPTKVSRIIENYREHILDAKNFSDESTLRLMLSQMVKKHVDHHGLPERKNKLQQNILNDDLIKKEQNIEINKEIDKITNELNIEKKESLPLNDQNSNFIRPFLKLQDLFSEKSKLSQKEKQSTTPKCTQKKLDDEGGVHIKL